MRQSPQLQRAQVEKDSVLGLMFFYDCLEILHPRLSLNLCFVMMLFCDDPMQYAHGWCTRWQPACGWQWSSTVHGHTAVGPDLPCTPQGSSAFPGVWPGQNLSPSVVGTVATGVATTDLQVQGNVRGNVEITSYKFSCNVPLTWNPFVQTDKSFRRSYSVIILSSRCNKMYILI